MSYNIIPEQYGIGLARKTGRLIAKRLFDHANRTWSVTSPPAVEPVTVAELKSFARIDYSDDDSMIESFIVAIRDAAEGYTGRAFIEQTIQMKMDYWPDVKVYLPRPPLISVTKVVTLDEDDTETEYDPDNYYVITDKHLGSGKIILKQSVTDPQNTDRYYGGFMVEYKAGYGDEIEDVPGSLRTGMMIWAAVVYDSRVFDPKNPPPEAKGFLDQYKLATMIVR